MRPSLTGHSVLVIVTKQDGRYALNQHNPDRKAADPKSLLSTEKILLPFTSGLLRQKVGAEKKKTCATQVKATCLGQC